MYTPEEREIYKTIGGIPGYDMQYSVFGEVVEGLEVAEKISEFYTKPGTAAEPEKQVKIVEVKILDETD